MFVAYLEHRGIVGNDYRVKHGVDRLFILVKARDHSGLVRLMSALKEDFNGDLLAPDGARTVWRSMSESMLAVLEGFLANVDLANGQRDFWH